MNRVLLRGVFSLAVAAFASSACDKSTEPTPITPSPTEITEPDFTGMLSVGGGVTKSFTVTGVGNVTTIVKDIQPNNENFTRTVGILLGVWSGTHCQAVIFNDEAGVGAGIAAQANAPTDLCVRVYDSGGEHALVEPVTFTVSITHF